ncbi:FHA domain-containing protein [Candidatus Woesearchaeota archaeon]|nr:FHA domain-containing protein [Candidatus Woesearchaeota archaeon]
MQKYLICIEDRLLPDNTGKWKEVHPGTFQIGRRDSIPGIYFQGQDIFLNDPTISKRHGGLRITETYEFFYTNYGTSWTTIDGVLFTDSDERKLELGSTIGFGLRNDDGAFKPHYLLSIGKVELGEQKQ